MNGRIRYEPLVSRIFPLEEAREAFEFKLSNPVIKVILKNSSGLTATSSPAV